MWIVSPQENTETTSMRPTIAKEGWIRAIEIRASKALKTSSEQSKLHLLKLAQRSRGEDFQLRDLPQGSLCLVLMFQDIANPRSGLRKLCQKSLL